MTVEAAVSAALLRCRRHDRAAIAQGKLCHYRVLRNRRLPLQQVLTQKERAVEAAVSAAIRSLCYLL